MKKYKSYLLILVGIVIGIVISCIFTKNNITLSNGDKVIMSINDYEITSDQLFTELKSTTALNVSLNMIDDIILDKLYTLSKEDEEKIEKNIEDMYTLYEDTYGYTKEEFLESEGFTSEKDFIKYMRSNYKKDLYYKDYLKKDVTETDIKNYYDKYVFGKKKVYMYSSGTKSDLNKVLSMLKKKKNFNYIKENNKDVVCEDLGYVDFQSEYDDIVLTTIKNTKKNKYSKIFEIDNYGYAIIYVVDSKKVETIDELKEEIIDKIISNIDSEDETKFNKAFIELRNKYNFKYYDKLLNDAYQKLVK